MQSQKLIRPAAFQERFTFSVDGTLFLCQDLTPKFFFHIPQAKDGALNKVKAPGADDLRGEYCLQ